MNKDYKKQERRNMIWRVTHQNEIRKFNIIIGLVIFLFVLLQLSMKLH